MQSEHLQNFNERLNQWVASQGLWFQLRYSMSSGGAKGAAMFHFLRILFRLGVVAAVVAGGVTVWLFSRTGAEDFKSEFEAAMKDGLGAEEAKVNGLKRVQGELSMTRLVARGGAGTFFTGLEARALRCRMGLLDGVRGVWEPGVIGISDLDVEIRAGADDAAAAEAISETVFRQFKGAKINSVDVAKANLRWGYFERAGRIDGSKLKMQRVEGGWRLSFRGGTFTQNWLRGVEIEELTVILRPDGLTFQKALLRDGLGTVDFSGLTITGGERPEVSGLAKLRRLSLAKVVPEAAREYVEGSISGDFKISGSTNTSEGVGFDGAVVLGADDKITLRDRVHLLRALSVVDAYNSYWKVDFNEGSFDLKTSGGRLVLGKLDLKAGDLMSLTGGMVVRPPTNAEVEQSLMMESATGQSSVTMTPAGGGGSLSASEDDQDFSLRRAGLAAKAASELDVTDTAVSLFDRVAAMALAREVREREAERRNREMQYEGELLLTLRPDAFAQAKELREALPVNPATGRVPLVVPLSGNLYTVTEAQAEELYIRGKR